MSATKDPSILPQQKASTALPSTPVLEPERADLQSNDGLPSTALDPEKRGDPRSEEKSSIFRSFGWLDRFLAVWILLAMITGVLLGKFVPNTGPALQKGKFVRVSVPIGMSLPSVSSVPCQSHNSHRPARHDVSDPLQSQVRESASCIFETSGLGADWLQYCDELDSCTFVDAWSFLGVLAG